MEQKTQNKIRTALRTGKPEEEPSVDQMLLLARTQWNGKKRKNRVTFFRFLLAQFRYIGWRIWLAELIAVVFPGLILRQNLVWHTITESTAVGLFCCLTVGMLMLCIPFVYRSVYYRMWEIEAAAFFSMKRLLLSRILILLLGGLAAIIGISAAMSARLRFENSMACMLFVFGTACDGILLLVRKMEAERLCRYFLVYGSSLLLIIIATARFMPYIYGGAFYNKALLGSCILLGYGIYQGGLLAGGTEETVAV